MLSVVAGTEGQVSQLVHQLYAGTSEAGSVKCQLEYAPALSRQILYGLQTGT